MDDDMGGKGGAIPSGAGLSPTVEPASSLDGSATSIPIAMTREFRRGWNAAIAAAEAIAIEWRDDNKAQCARLRSRPLVDQMMVDMLDGAAIECNAIAGEIHKLVAENDHG